MKYISSESQGIYAELCIYSGPVAIPCLFFTVSTCSSRSMFMAVNKQFKALGLDKGTNWGVLILTKLTMSLLHLWRLYLC